MEWLAKQSSSGRMTVALMAVLIAMTIAFNVVDEIEYERDTDIINQGFQDILGYTLLAGGLALTITGFILMRRARWDGAVLVIGGIWTAALMVFWLIVPLFIAAAVTAFAVHKAKHYERVP